jgi:hypothetical protein
MPSHPRNMPEQEHSIKERSHELFVEDTPVPEAATKPFKVYLHETPAQPLSLGFKALIWVLGVIVGVLFLLALWRIAHRHQARPPTRSAPAETVTVRDTWHRPPPRCEHPVAGFHG